MASPTPPSGAGQVRERARSVLTALARGLARFKGPIVAIAGVGAVLSGFVGWYTTYKAIAATPTVQSTPTQNADAINPLSILVLPFTNQTGDASKGYIADALTSSISADLSRIRDAFVVPTATAFTYKDKNLTVAQIGKDAGVRFVLQGSVVASGDKLRISAQLADTQSGRQLWNETLEGDATKLFELQDLVTARIGNSIGNEMVIMAARESEKRKSSPKVADLKMRQRGLGLKPLTKDTFNQRESLLRAIIKQEPDNAVATAELANLLTIYVVNFLDGQSPRAQPILTEAKALALRAKAIDDQLPDIYSALATVASSIDKDNAEMRRYFEIVLKLAPKDPRSYNDLAVWYFYDGQPKVAIEFLDKALSLYPKAPYPSILTNMTRCYWMLGDNSAAIIWGQKAIDADPTYHYNISFLAMAYSSLGQMDKARQYTNQYKQLVEIGQSPGIEKIDGSESPAYVKYYNEHYLPEWRKAGLPE
ncbi:tetratricopeptide repeat protein [Paucibacter sp. Y2R2-4]|uniref:tetratricopeptide repeat protein n=1 Tax=Paucibacter sp. Y2R2-4 TaxID=2893553 RepID=UPI0021E3D7F0|nr:tetratricopeptide repeat protein [Paucibacter sp. Y2R2-4]MCV2350669.1 tetratricopeptide repeat protein [Paucibacter sp. Y2R2-4]